MCFATQHSDSKDSCAKTLQDSYGSEANEKKSQKKINFFLKKNVFCLKAQFSPLSTVYPRAFTHFYAFLRIFTRIYAFFVSNCFCFFVVLFGLFLFLLFPILVVDVLFEFRHAALICCSVMTISVRVALVFACILCDCLRFARICPCTSSHCLPQVRLSLHKHAVRVGTTRISAPRKSNGSTIGVLH